MLEINEKGKKYDAVVVSRTLHSRLLRLVVSHLEKNSQAATIYLISSHAAQQKNPFAGKKNLVILDEDSLIPSVSLQSLMDYFAKRGVKTDRVGWYYQQFLKMGMAVRPGIKDYYLIWDADTIMLSPMCFFDQGGKVIMCKQKEHHPPYFETYQRLLNQSRAADFSFIAEHMMITTQVMKQLIEHIRPGSLKTGDWVWRILEVIPDQHLEGAGFSEYETYGNFIHSHFPNMVKYRQAMSLRHAAHLFGIFPSPYDLYRLSRKYQYASFEEWNVGNPFRVGLEKLISLVLYPFIRWQSGIRKTP
ncbi:MAG: DUF6492 family protein [Thermodesulfobacteriota bacterium]|nr:DUF6492 family protein [Thermodesulfobacteriota bacterium]